MTEEHSILDTTTRNMVFESIKHVNEYGQEYWTARELQPILEYKRWDKFANIIQKAMTACANSNHAVSDHFAQVGKMVSLVSEGMKKAARKRQTLYKKTAFL